MDVWTSDPLFYPAKPPAHWLMLGGGRRTSCAGPAGPIPLGRSEHLPTNRLLRGVFGPRRYLPEGP